MHSVTTLLKRFSLPRAFGAAGAALVLLAGCDTGPAPSLYDPEAGSAPDPVIQSVSPEGSAFAGVDVVTLVGRNFSPEEGRNLVYFGGERAQVVDVSATQIRVIPPPSPNPEVGIRVAVVGAENFSNTWTYALEPAFEVHGGLGKVESLTAMTTDSEGNMYVGLTVDGVSRGLKKITPEGVRTDFADTGFQWAGLAWGPDQKLYAVRNLRAIFSFEQGGSQQVVTAFQPSGVRLTVLAFDAAGNIFAAGRQDEIFRIGPDRSTGRYAVGADEVTALAVSGNTLYAGIVTGEESGVWAYPIDAAGDLGAGHRVVDVRAAVGAGRQASGLAFGADGTLYLATGSADPVWFQPPGGTLQALYPGVLRQPNVGGTQIPPVPSLDLAWGPAPFLYLLQSRASPPLAGDSRPMIRINTRNAPG